MSEYLKCPECGNADFEEISLCWTRQEGVKIKTTGQPDYYAAEDVVTEDSPPEGEVYYKCPECDGEFVLRCKKLQRKEDD